MKTEAFIHSCTYSKKWKKNCIGFHCKFTKINPENLFSLFYKRKPKIAQFASFAQNCSIPSKLLHLFKIAQIAQNCSKLFNFKICYAKMLCLVKWLSPHGFWADTKSAIVRCISLEGIESTRTAGSLMKLVFLELRLDNLQYQLPELVGQGFK